MSTNAIHTAVSTLCRAADGAASDAAARIKSSSRYHLNFSLPLIDAVD